MLTELVDKVYEFNLYLAKLQKNDPSVDQLSFRMDFVLQGNDNWQQKIANALKDNTNVTSLDLSRNPSFGDDGAKELTHVLRDNKYITKVNLSATKLGHEGCEALAEALRTNEAITELNISENPDMKDGLDALLDSLKYNRTLRTLDLSGDQIGPNKVEKFGAALHANTTLLELNLSNNVLKSEGAEDFFAVLRSPNVHLKHLDVSQNELEPDCVNGIATAIRLNSSLESLSMRGNPIGHCLAPIIKSLSKNGTLKKLDLSSTGIGRKGESEFAQLLENLKLRTRDANRIQVLEDSEPDQQSPTNVPDDSTLQSGDERKHDKKRKSSKRRVVQQQQEDDDNSYNSHNSGKSTNSMTDMHISKDNRCALEELILARNNIEGMRLISALKTNETLTALSLASNPLSQDSFDALLHLLQTSPYLNSVDLSEIALIGDKEAVQFADMLKNEAVTISGLSLARTRIEERGSHTLLEAVKKNKTLISLNLKGVRISAEDLKDITNWFVTSPTMFILEVDQDDKKGLLRTKNLEHLGLTRFPPALFKMINLQRLNISNNQITEIPDDIAHLKELRELDVSNNRLVALPPALGQLKDTLKSLRFHNNPLKTPPRDIIHKPVKIILGYLKDLQGGFEDIYRVKMMVVGQENVGKTTLLKLLSKKARKKMPKKREEDKESKTKPIAMLHSKKGLRKYLSTDGIDISDVSLEVTFDEDGKKVKKPVTVSTWDFAGQEIYYTTHEFFLSDHSVFLLVWDLSKDEQDSRVAFWLNSIHSRAPNAPIILVGTHLDDPVCLQEGYVEKVLKNLKEKYKPRFPMLKHAFAVSCAWSNADGMIALLESIRVTISEMSIMGQSIPKTYLALENVIREEKRVCNPPYKSWRSFSQMASLCNIKGDELKRCAEVLHAMGSIVWFDDPKLGLNDLVILDCKYLTNIFATIITTKHNYIKDGILPHSVLRHIWKPPQYPLEIHTQLLQLLEKFEIAYRLDQSSLRGRSSSFSLDVPAKAHFAPGDLEFSLVPSLLPLERPNIDVLWRKYDLSQVQYDRIYEFEFLPKALFSRLMVRLLYYADKIHKYWRKGLVASADDTLFLLEMYPTKNRIQVTVRGGKNPGAVLKDLIETIEGFIVLTNWWQINVTRKITCPHCLQELASLYNPQESDSESESVSTVSRSLRTSFDEYSSKATLHRFDRKHKEKEKKKSKSKHKKFPKKPGKHQQRHSISVTENSSQELIAASISNSSPDLFDPTVFELAECERAASAGVWFLRCHGIHPVRLDALAPDITLSDHERFKIPYDELHLGEEIGTGTYGNIKKAEWQGQIVAVKQLKREEEGPGEREKVFNDFRREVWIMSGIKHPNVVNLIGFCLQPQFCLIMEFLPCGDLYSFIHNKEQALDMPRVLKIALDIACGMRHLHSATPPFVHRDLKSPNILMVDSDPMKPVMAKVGDFGLSSRMFVPYLRETMRHRLVENPTWLAPEITREEEFNEKSDIYAYGIILWELLTRKHPFEDWGFNFMFELEDAVKLEKKRPDIPSECPDVLSKLVRDCWEDDPLLRPSFTDIMELLITLVKEKCANKVAIPPTYYVGTRWESEFVTEDVHRTLSTTHDSARRRVSRTNLQYSNNNMEDNEFDPSPASLKLQGRFFKKLKWYNPDVEIVELLSVPENQIWAGGSDGSVSVWNSLSGELIDRNYHVHRNSPITAMITIGQGTVAPPTSMTQLTRHASNSQVTTHNLGVCVWTCGQHDDKINVWAVRPLEQQTNLLVTSQNMIAMLFVKIDGANKDKSWRQRICQIKDRQLLVHEADKLLHVLELEGNNHGVADPFAHGENCFYLDSPEPARYYFQVPHQDSFQDWLMILKAWQKPTSLDGNMIRLASIQNTHTVGLTCLVEVSGQVWSGDTRGNICVWDVKERRLLKRLKLFREGEPDVPSSTKVRTMLCANMFVWVAIENYLYCIDPIRYSMVSTVVMPSGINCMIGVKLSSGKKLWVALQDSTIKVFDIEEGLKEYRRKYSIASASTPIIEVHDETKRMTTRLALVDKHGEESSPSLEHKGNNTNHNNAGSDADATPVRKTSRKHREVESKQLRRHQRADFPCIKTMGPIPLMGVQDFVNIQSNWIWSAGDDGVIRIWNASTYEMFAVLEKKHDGPITMMILWGTTVWSASKGGTICIWT